MRRIFNYVKYPVAILYLIAYHFASIETKQLINMDIKEMNRRYRTNKGLLFWLVNFKSYRSIFYARIPKSRIIGLLLPAHPTLIINCKEGIGGGVFALNHPYSTIINAKKIGNYFTFCQLTTVGNAIHGRNDLVPTIGDNVSLGANTTIIGDISIGNNVIVGAGSVVVKNVPDNCVVAGNPAKIIRYLSEK